MLLADRGAEFVPAQEWMRICFELLDLLNTHKKGIHWAAVNSFGYIAKSLGPQDVLSVLLTNLQVQERQSRMCSTVAIAIIAETCGPFTCILAILNEYWTVNSTSALAVLRHSLSGGRLVPQRVAIVQTNYVFPGHSERVPDCLTQ